MDPGTAEREPLLVVLFGPGGVGKGTVAERVVATDPSLHLSRSWTTRSRRPGEPEDAYVFVDRPTFEAHAAAGGFFEWAEFLGNLYGTPTVAPAAAGRGTEPPGPSRAPGPEGPEGSDGADGADRTDGSQEGGALGPLDTLLEIDLQGARQVRDRRPDALLILLVPPSLAVQEERLRARGDDEAHIRRRLDEGIAEMEAGRELADAVVVNDDLDRAVDQVAGILASYRASRS